MSPLGREGHFAQSRGRTRRFTPSPVRRICRRGLVPRPAAGGQEERITSSRAQQASVPTDSLQSPHDLAQEGPPPKTPGGKAARATDRTRAASAHTRPGTPRAGRPCYQNRRSGWLRLALLSASLTGNCTRIRYVHCPPWPQGPAHILHDAGCAACLPSGFCARRPSCIHRRPFCIPTKTKSPWPSKSAAKGPESAAKGPESAAKRVRSRALRQVRSQASPQPRSAESAAKVHRVRSQASPLPIILYALL